MLYDLMLQCWQMESDKRPTFAQITVAVDDMQRELVEDDESRL